MDDAKCASVQPLPCGQHAISRAMKEPLSAVLSCINVVVVHTLH